MKKIFTLIFTSLLLFSCKDFKEFFSDQFDEIQASEEFVQGSEDIPLLFGMEKTSDETVGFDSSEGSIIASIYESKIDLQKVRNFYVKTLPQMGWKLEQNGEKSAIFKREKEKLEIEFSKDGEKKIVKFFISSAL